MPRIVVPLVLSAVAALALTACADSSNQKHPPQDPPDYQGVPTDTRPPSMLIEPSDSGAK